MTLFVANVSKRTSHSQLLDLFDNYGECDVDIKVGGGGLTLAAELRICIICK